MTAPRYSPGSADVADAATGWLTAFEEALSGRGTVATLFAEDAHWRDLSAFTGDVGIARGVASIERLLQACVPDTEPSKIRLSETYAAPQQVPFLLTGETAIQAFFEFTTSHGCGTGLVCLVDREGATVAASLLTRLDGVEGHERYGAGRRPEGLGIPNPAEESWARYRSRRAGYEDHDPEVLVVGGGHHGIFAAVHLERLGVDTLIVDRLPRVGDNWRTRYESLALHTPTDVNHFSFLPFPANYPEYLPKDRVANWIEGYVDAMEVNFWTSTEFLGGEFDESDHEWCVRLRLPDGTERVMRPKHVIIATGAVGGRPNIPKLAGIENFAGEVTHTKDFRSGHDYHGKEVLVVGVGTSGHDVALDMTRKGARVTMMQRHPTSVVTLPTTVLCYPPFFFDGRPYQEADFLATAALALPVLESVAPAAGAMCAERDRDLLDRLEAAGLRIDDHPGGWVWKTYSRGAGYYIDVGCSEMIANGSIRIVQADDVATFTEAGLLFVDGRQESFDAVELATGYQNQQAETERYFGREVAQKVGPIWGGYDEVGEMRNGFKPTPQRGLWFTVSGIAMGRMLTPQMAAVITAHLRGLGPGPRYNYIAQVLKDAS